MSSNHVPRQRRSRRTGTEEQKRLQTERRQEQARQRAEAQRSAFIELLATAPNIDFACFVRDEFALAMQWVEIMQGNFKIIDEVRYNALMQAIKTTPGMVHSLHGIVRALLWSDARSEILEHKLNPKSGPYPKNAWTVFSNFEATSYRLNTENWFKIMEQKGHQVGQKTTRETAIRVVTADLNLEQLKALADEHELLPTLGKQATYRTQIKEQGDLLIKLAGEWIFTGIPEGAEHFLLEAPQRPNWDKEKSDHDNRQALRLHSRQLNTYRWERQCAKGFTAFILSHNVETTLIVLRLIANDETEWNETVATPWAAMQGANPLPKSISSLFPTEANQAQQESA
jgi:hypothetical protein